MKTDERASHRSLTLRLPGLVAGRDLADQMLDRLADSYEDRSVVVDATRTSTGTVSFATQLVQHVLVTGNASLLVVAGAPSRFAQHCQDAADRAGVTDRLQVTPFLPGHETPAEETGTSR